MVSINHDLKAIFIHLPKNGGSSISSILHNHYGFDGIRAYRTDHCYFNEDVPNMKLESFEHIDSTLHKRFVKMHATYNIRRRGIMRYFKQYYLKDEDNPSKKKKKKIFYLRKNFTAVDDVVITDEMWNTYFKFVFIRNPYDRVISGWKFSTRGMPIKPKLIDFLRNKNRVTNVSYSHTFITQKAQLIEPDNKTIDFDYYGDFNNLNEELIKVLLHLGVKTIKHERLIEKDIIMNKGKEEETKTPYYKYYENQEILDLVNDHFREDFEYFGYQMYDTIEDIKNNYEKVLSIPMTNRGKLNRILEIVANEEIKEETKEPPKEEIKEPPKVKAKRGRKKKEETKDANKEETKDANKEETKDANKEETKDANKEETKDANKEETKDANKEETKDANKEETKDANKEETKEIYRINNIKKSNRSLINELKDKKLLDDQVININIDEKNRKLINNVANRLLKKKCIPNLIFMKQATCCGHTANCGCEHICPNIIANGGAMPKKPKKDIPHNCGNANCTLNIIKTPEEDISELYIKYKEARNKEQVKISEPNIKKSIIDI
jgi:hypothetical protein